MNDDELLKKILDKAIDMFCIARNDRYIYGNSFIEFKERGMNIINPKDLTVQVIATNKQIKHFGKEIIKLKKRK